MTDEEKMERIGIGFAMAMGALWEIAAHGCPTDRTLARAAIEDVNREALDGVG